VQTHALLKALVQTLQSYKKIIDGLKNGFKKSQIYKKNAPFFIEEQEKAKEKAREMVKNS